MRSTRNTMQRLLVLAGLLTVASAVIPAAGAQVVPGRHIAVFHDDVADPARSGRQLARQHGVRLGHVYQHALKGFSFEGSVAAAQALARNPQVAFVEADQIVVAWAQSVPTGVDRVDADLNSTANLDGVDDFLDVDVAIIDTGIDLSHPDLLVYRSTNCARGGPRGGDCKDGDGNDGNGHGTHVAGTVAALDNGAGVVGVAPGARLWAVRVLGNDGSGWMSWIIAGVDWVADHADEIEVANMSLGCECYSAALDIAIASSVAEGVTYAVAAGNSAKDAATFSPANHPDVITVSAIADFDGQPGGLALPTCRNDEDDTFADFSNFGSKVEIAAPGVCIFSTWKDGGYKTISGTSMASPHVAGAAALVKADNPSPSFTPAHVLAALLASAIPQSDSDGFTDDPDGFTGDPDVFAEPLLNVANGPPNDAPTVSITSPSEGNTFDSGATISFAGAASDTEDGDLTTYLAWTSDIDGSIGTGGSFSWTLSDGNHTITASVSDGSGKSGSDSMGITVSAPPNDAPTVSISSPADGSVFDSGATILFEGTASDTEDGDLTASLAWTSDIDGPIGSGGGSVSTTLSDGDHTITASVSDSGSKSGSDSIGITVGTPPSGPTTVSVGSIVYATEGGKNKDKHLLTTISLVDDLGNPASGASVSVTLDHDSGAAWSGTATTGTEGTVTFTLKNAPSGCYTTTVTEVTAAGLIWVGVSPPEGFCK